MSEYLALPYAGLGRRLVALLIDLFVTWVLVVLAFGFAGFVLGLAGFSIELGGSEVLEQQSGGNPTSGVWTMTALAYIVYFTFMEARSGATLGKRLLRLRVVTQAGEPIGWWASLLRNLLRPIDAVGGFLFALGARHQRIGDRVANTVVVKS